MWLRAYAPRKAGAMANWYGNVVRGTTTSGYEQISAMRSEAAQTATPMRWADRAP
jgi:hypothetical protein